jgi:hypothetical protein
MRPEQQPSCKQPTQAHQRHRHHCHLAEQDPRPPVPLAEGAVAAGADALAVHQPASLAVGSLFGERDLQVAHPVFGFCRSYVNMLDRLTAWRATDEGRSSKAIVYATYLAQATIAQWRFFAGDALIPARPFADREIIDLALYVIDDQKQGTVASHSHSFMCAYIMELLAEPPKKLDLELVRVAIASAAVSDFAAGMADRAAALSVLRHHGIEC